MKNNYGLIMEDFEFFKYCYDIELVLEKIKDIRIQFNFYSNVYIYFFKNNEELQSVMSIQIPSWSSGFCIENNIVIVNPDYWVKTDKYSIDEAIIHEFTHVVINSLTNCPLWINEGMAQYYSKEYLKFINDTRLIDKNLEIYSLDYNSKELYYVSAILISNIIKRFGENEVVNRLINTSDFKNDEVLGIKHIQKYIKEDTI